MIVASLLEFGNRCVLCHFGASAEKSLGQYNEKGVGGENLKRQRPFFPAKALFIEMSEGFLRLRLRNDMLDFNDRTQHSTMQGIVLTVRKRGIWRELPLMSPGAYGVFLSRLID